MQQSTSRADKGKQRAPQIINADSSDDEGEEIARENELEESDVSHTKLEYELLGIGLSWSPSQQLNNVNVSALR